MTHFSETYFLVFVFTQFQNYLNIKKILIYKKNLQDEFQSQRVFKCLKLY